MPEARERHRSAVKKHRLPIRRAEISRRAELIAVRSGIDKKTESKEERAKRRDHARDSVKNDERWQAWLLTQRPDPSTLRLKAACRKIRMYPTREQRRILETYVRGAKATWNMAADMFNKREIHIEEVDARSLDRKIVTAEGLLQAHKRKANFLARTPAQIRKLTTRRFEANVKTVLKNEQNAVWRLGGDARRKPIVFKTWPARKHGAAFGVEAQYTALHLSACGQDNWVRFHASDTPCTKDGTMFPGRIRLQPTHKKDRKPPRDILRACEEAGQKLSDMTVVRQRGIYYLCVPTFERASDEIMVELEAREKEIRDSLLDDSGGGASSNGKKRRREDGEPRASSRLPAEGGGGGEEEKIDETRIVALDPGVRTFLTGFCPGTGDTLEYGRREDVRRRHNHLTRKQDKIKERLSKEARAELRAQVAKRTERRLGREPARAELRAAFRKKLYGLRRGLRKYKTREDNAILQLHLQTASELLAKFDHVILPRFSTLNIHRLPISDAEKRFAKRLNHFKFRERIQQATWRFAGRKTVWLCSEAQTTMCCGSCGRLNRNVGAATEFACPWSRQGQCALARVGRDAHAARNIYLKTAFGTQGGSQHRIAPTAKVTETKL